MADLNATYFDAQHMYDFLANVVCKDIRDITIMSEPRDFFRLFKKPVYEGDFLTQMFDWNCNHPAAELETEKVRKGMIAIKAEGESWESFKTSYNKVRYRARHETASWKRAKVVDTIERFKKFTYDPENDDSIEQVNMELEKEADELRIKAEDFWLKPDDPRRELLFRKMHPLIFLKESLPSYVKIQNNWVFQFLTDREKKAYI